MGKFDDFVESATYRLRPDPELRMDVANELRAHLEDAAEAARTAGATEPDAEQQAMRDFGDPEVIANKLWEANFRRMRLRAVAKWASRLVLMPAAVLLAMLLCWEAAGFLAFLSVTGKSPHFGQLRGSLERQMHLPYRNDLSPDDEVAKDILERTSRSRYEDAQRLVARFPENRLFRAHMALGYLVHNKIGRTPQPLAAATVAEALTLLEECERVEPENAFYNYLKAGSLFYVGAKLEEAPDFTYQTPYAEGKTRQAHGFRLIMMDRVLFQRGLDEYRKGIAKPYCDAYVVPFTDYYIGLRRSPETLLQEMRRIAIAAGQLLPHLSLMRNQTRVVMAYAALLVGEGNRSEATELIRTASIPGTQVGARSQTMIELLVGRAMRQIALLQGAVLYEKMGMAELAAEVRETARRESGKYGIADVPYEEEQLAFSKRLRRQGGILGGMLLPTDPVPETMLKAMREAERANLERTALGALAALFLAFIGWCGLRTLAAMWRHRKDAAGPKLLFIGWKRLGLVILAGVVLPVAAYAMLTRLPFGSAHYGVNYASDRVAVEMALTIALMLGITVFLGMRAFRQRAREAGMAIPARRFSRFIANLALFFGVLWALAAVWYFWHWNSMRGAGYVLCAGIGFVCLLALASAALWRPDAGEREYVASERRSLVPVLVVCLVVLGVFTRIYLFAAERSAIRALQQPGLRLHLDELKYSCWSDYQDYLRNLPDNGALQLPK